MTTTQHPQDVVIVGAARTPQGRLLGGAVPQDRRRPRRHHHLRSTQAFRRGRQPVDYVLMGPVVQAAAGQNPAKQAAVAAGLGMNVPAMTVNRSACPVWTPSSTPPA